jgi:LCP family protein required for cell wall assembly
MLFLLPNYLVIKNIRVGDDDTDDGDELIEHPMALTCDCYSDVNPDKLDEDIPYVVRVDFKGFEKLIDEVDGIDIYVEKSFEDTSFPDENYAYRTVSFTKGWEHMNGTRALDYARSRHGNNGEASDFSRSRRQQRVLEALKEKLLSFNTISNPVRLKKIIDVLGTHLATNLELWEIVRLTSLAPYFKDSIPNAVVLQNGPSGLLTETTGQDGAYLLLPNDGNFEAIQHVVDTLCTPNATPEKNNLAAPQEPIHIAVYNGTWEVGLAATWKEKLEKNNYSVVEIGNAKEKPYDHTTVYLMNERPDTKKKAQELLDFFKSSAPLSISTRSLLLDSPMVSSTPTLDVIVILGHDQLEQPSL